MKEEDMGGVREEIGPKTNTPKANASKTKSATNKTAWPLFWGRRWEGRELVSTGHHAREFTTTTIIPE